MNQSTKLLRNLQRSAILPSFIFFRCLPHHQTNSRPASPVLWCLWPRQRHCTCSGWLSLLHTSTSLARAWLGCCAVARGPSRWFEISSGNEDSNALYNYLLLVLLQLLLAFVGIIVPKSVIQIKLNHIKSKAVTRSTAASSSKANVLDCW